MHAYLFTYIHIYTSTFTHICIYAYMFPRFNGSKHEIILSSPKRIGLGPPPSPFLPGNTPKKAKKAVKSVSKKAKRASKSQKKRN